MATYRENSGILGINDRKQKENHPDYNGKLLVTKPGLYYLSGWKRNTRNGQPILSLAAELAPDDKQAEAKESLVDSTPSVPAPDDLPF